jgi:hypothetical protein
MWGYSRRGRRGVRVEEVIILAREEDRRHGSEATMAVQVCRFRYNLGAEEGFIREITTPWA